MPPSLQHTLAQLQQSQVRAYHQSALPSALDDEVAALVRQFAQADEAQRQAIDAQVTEEHSYGFLIFAERMAALAVREQAASRLRDGLLAIGLERFRLDLREDLMVMSLLHHSALRIGADPDATFRAVYDAVPAQVAREFETFIQRPAELKRIGTMGYREADDAGGFRYDRTKR